MGCISLNGINHLFLANGGLANMSYNPNTN